MLKEKLEFYRSVLMEKRMFILSTIERLREMSQIKETEVDLHEKYSYHLADQSSDSLRREESFMLISRELIYLNRIDNALKSIDHGDYGICKVCGKEIPHERLEAVPTTDTCISCKTTHIKRFNMN